MRRRLSTSWPTLRPHEEPRLLNRYDVERAVAKSDLPPIGRHIVLVLCQRMQQGSTLIPREHSPSITTLAAGTGWNRRTITRHLAVLEDAGWIIRHRPPVHLARTMHARTAYTVLIPELGTGSPTARDTRSRGLGAQGPKARGVESIELGAKGPEARGAAPFNTGLSDIPDQSDTDAEEIELVIKNLMERTGVTVTTSHAAIVRDAIVARPHKNRRAYLIRCLVTDKNPQRWLDTTMERTSA